MKIISESWNAHIYSKTKQDAAYQTLKTAIISLDLPPNTMLVERYIMERFELGRTPMREALNKLQAEGFITSLANKGFMVNDFQYKDFIELYELKEALESKAASLCCQRKNSESIAYIESIFNKYEENFEQKHFIKSILLDLDFHWALVERCGNQRIERQMSLVMDQTLKFFNLYYSDDIIAGMSKSFCDQHRRILDAVKGDDPEEARRAVIDHIQDVLRINRESVF